MLEVKSSRLSSSNVALYRLNHKQDEEKKKKKHSVSMACDKQKEKRKKETIKKRNECVCVCGSKIGTVVRKQICNRMVSSSYTLLVERCGRWCVHNNCIAQIAQNNNLNNVSLRGKRRREFHLRLLPSTIDILWAMATKI